MGQWQLLPEVVQFVCESCQWGYSLDFIREHKGRCGHCAGQSWTLNVVFTERKRDFSSLLISLGLGLVFGPAGRVAGHMAGGGEERREMTFPGVSADDAFKICQVRYREGPRVLEYIKYRQQLEADEHRQEMIDRGGRACCQCRALFVPVPDKPWTQAGFCCKLCYSRAFSDSLQGDDDGVLDA